MLSKLGMRTVKPMLPGMTMPRPLRKLEKELLHCAGKFTKMIGLQKTVIQLVP